MKIKIVILSLLLVSAAVLGAQTVHDPNSEIYQDIERWHVQGYVREFLPIVRPYPIPLIDKILKEVIDNGDAAAQKKASEYQAILAPGSRFFHLGVLGFAQGNGSDFSLIGAPFVEGLGRINNLLSISYNLAMYGVTDTNGGRFNVPGTYSPYVDLIEDTADIGPIRIRQQWTSLAAIGKSDLYFQAGLSRTSYGPFYDNGIVLGPQAPRAGHFAFVFWQPKWSFEILLQIITATDDLGGNTFFPNKFNVVQTYSIRPLENLELGLTQTLTYGGRFEILYLAPFSYLFASQSIFHFDDNAFLGLYFRWRPFDTFLVKGQVYVDDLSFNGLSSGDSKVKIAAELGISWAPKESILSKLDFDYTAVFPYTYTHWPLPDRDMMYSSESPNYYNYTHLGKNIGPDLDPNSDRISLRTSWNLHPSIGLNFSAYLVRHANASTDPRLIDQGYNNGSIFDHGTEEPATVGDGKNILTYGWYLTQGLIGMRIGGTLGISWTLPTSFGVFKLFADYGIQYNKNRWGPKQAPQSGVNGFDHFWSIGAQWSW
ncbi:MAG: hypothetical protein LBI14_00565 [Treponema sp.]|jgi:hypothetical protein|nr:hypothetical protein [Treponema sp.]